MIAVGEKLLVGIDNGKPGETQFCIYDTNIFVRRLPEVNPTFNPRLYHLHQLQRSIIVFTCTIKYSSLREQGMIFYQGVGMEREQRNTCPSYQWFVGSAWWSLIIQCNCQTECSTTCKKHGISCSIVCGNCKGSGCNSITNEVDGDDDAIDNDKLFWISI